VPRISWGRLACRAAIGAFVLIVSQMAEPVVSQASAQAVGPKKSGLPIPRFVTLKSGRVNLRVGPGRNYPVEWMYLKSGLPVEVIQEYDNWRRIRDSEGTEGWINQSLLSGKRSGIAAPWFKGKEASITLTREPDQKSRLIATVEPGAMGMIEQCDGQWCEMRFGSYSGYVQQALIWGAYPDEKFDD
jgi:SH3-like domain-containing protein